MCVMKQTVALLLLGSCLLASVTVGAVAAEDGKKEPEAAEKKSHVVTLTDATFDDALKNSDVLVKFYAPWCGHCKRMAPEYEKAAALMTEKGSKVVFAEVDATTETAVADKQAIREYPTVKLYHNQRPENYAGDRTAEDIVEWVEMMTGPAVTEVDGDIGDKDVKTVAFVAELKSRDSPTKELFEKVADKSRQLGQFLVKYDAPADRVYAIRPEEGTEEFAGKTADELQAFVDIETYPLLGPINSKNFRKYIDREVNMAWLCGSVDDFNEAKQSVREAARKLRGKYYFVWLDTGVYRGHAENALGVTEFPALVFQAKEARYALPGPDVRASLKDPAKIVSFFEDIEAGKVERLLKSEPVPESQNESVKVVVGKNFETMVIQEDKDVLLEIYAPWCQYCQNFEPVYKEFAEKMKDNEHLVVAKMDGSANETPLAEFSWNTYPTLFFVKAGEKSPIKFEGSRTVEGLEEFVKKHSTKPLTSDRGEEL
ncbi:UNVERIFIED_CONTAM: hypothetical protein H355_013976 [Colinus virginianus]|nr:hypothetical protein H355_013976 [Colinus virginianus]